MLELDISWTMVIIALATAAIQISLFTPKAAPVAPAATGVKTAYENIAQTLATQHPNPIWRVNEYGHVVWKNKAAERNGTHLTTLAQAPVLDEPFQRRIALPDALDGTLNFDITMLPLENGAGYFATPADAELRAEQERSTFIQTLSKTFAQLSTGLAIFDKNRTLVLFNPAALELLKLKFETLSSRPHLHSFLDHLRDTGQFPEPKDYKAWRDQITDLENAAEQGTYVELWSLPNDQTLRVTGRPHPDGAIALLFEDVSIEITLSRLYRAQIDQAEQVIGALDTAVILFGPDGGVIRTNTAYDKLWQHDATAASGPAGVIDCTRLWRVKSKPSDIWSHIRNIALDTSPAPMANYTITTHRGQILDVRCQRLPGRSTMIEFSPIAMVNEKNDLAAMQA